jgi:hypothetical protein
MFNSSCWQINIVLIKDGIRTLVDIVIVDPTRVYLLPWTCAPQGFVAFDAAQAKKKKLSQSTSHYSIPPFNN